MSEYIKGFKNCNIYIEEQGILKTSLLLSNKKIAAIGQDIEEGIELNDDLIVVPGFIDRHIHGANHSDAMYPNFDDVLNIAKTIASEGVTAFLPTTMTQKIENIDKALENLRCYIDQKVEDGAEVLGVHLEGPFINKIYKGAQPEEMIIASDVEVFKHFEEMSGGNIKQVTLAYEENGRELTEYLASKNIVVSIGHSNATAKQVKEAADHGVTSLTHAYNAMKGLHHREAGTIGGALLDDRIYLEVIADLVHVSAEAIQILYRIKGKEKLNLVTDAIEAKHLEDGIYHLGGQSVTVRGSEARLSSGVLAGSTLHMNQAIKNIMQVLNISITDAVDLATISVAKCLKIDNQKGSIKIGKDADFTIIDRCLNIYMTVRGGKIIYQKS